MINPEELRLKARLQELNLINGNADRVINRPGQEVWRHAGNDADMFRQVCENVHWLGFSGPVAWVWGPGANGNPTGEALARGLVTNTNCGGFNLTARWIAENICGIQGSQGTYVGAAEFFLTGGNTVGIDRAWQGSVRTLTHDFAQVGSYFFKGHSWSRLNGVMHDSSTNNYGFNHADNLKWCDLMMSNRQTQATDGRCFMINRTHNPVLVAGPAPYACVSTVSLKKFKHLFPIVAVAGQQVTQGFIGGMPNTTGQGNWQTFLVVSRDHLPAPFRSQVHL
jgi:hypothetical protein